MGYSLPLIRILRADQSSNIVSSEDSLPRYLILANPTLVSNEAILVLVKTVLW